MSLFLNRDKAGAADHLEWKVGFFSAGAVFALVGMFFEERWMTGVAIAILAMGMFLRFLPGFRPSDTASEETDVQGES